MRQPQRAAAWAEPGYRLLKLSQRHRHKPAVRAGNIPQGRRGHVDPHKGNVFGPTAAGKSDNSHDGSR